MWRSVGFCEHVDELWGSVKQGLNRLYQLHRKPMYSSVFLDVATDKRVKAKYGEG